MAVVYVVTAWLLIQVAGEVAEPLHLPAWFSTAVIVLLALGFPVALGLAWAFEIKPEPADKERHAIEPSNANPADKSSKPEPVGATEPEPYLITRRSVAVLPFENMSDDASVTHFASGLTEEILNDLSKLQDLKVASRSSTLGYKDTNLQATAIGDELGVSYLLEGSVRKLGDELRITVQLIRVPDDEHVWAHTFERSLAEGFAAQEKVARIVAHTSQATIVSNVAMLAARRQTDDARAYRNFRIAAEERWQQVIGSHSPNWTLVIENFKRAVELDPNFAVAYEALANAYMFRADPTIGRNEASEKAHEAMSKAMELRPPSAYTYMNLAQLYINVDANYPAATDALDKGVAIAPNFPWLHMFYATIALRQGRISDALARARTAAELTPGDSQIMQGLAHVLWALGDYPAAIAAIETSLETMASGPEYIFRSTMLALMLLEQGNQTRANAILDYLISSQLEARNYGSVAVTLAHADRMDDVDKIYQQMLANEVGMSIPGRSRFLVHLAAGEMDEAFKWLGWEIEERTFALNDLRADMPFLSTMRDDLRWHQVIDQLEDMEARAAAGH